VGALHAPMLAVSAVAFLAVLRILEDYVVYPRLMRRGVQLHPLAVILGILAGAELDGVAGMFLAVPVTAIGSVLFRHWIGWRSDDAAEATSSSEPAPVQFSTA
jgi:predicted PurR-regulated permease PerM